MKQFILIFPKTKAYEFATYCFSNEIRVMLSWVEGSDFFGADKIHAICVAPEDKTTAMLNSEWKQFIQK
jgi:hypothetical protein